MTPRDERSLQTFLRLRLGYNDETTEWAVQRYQRARVRGDQPPVDFNALLRAPIQDPGFQAFVDSVLIPKTAFFRHREQLEAIQASFPEGPLRVWSAACATGEEAYSIALVFGPDRDVEVLGTDLSETHLSIARAGRYAQKALAEVPPRYRVAPDPLSPYRTRVRFELFNLAEDGPRSAADAGGWDLILCRNVLIYLGEDCRRAALQRLLRRLGPKGLLLLSPAERPPVGAQLELLSLAPGVYAYRRTNAPDAALGASIAKLAEARAALEATAPESAARAQRPEAPTPTAPTRRRLQGAPAPASPPTPADDVRGLLAQIEGGGDAVDALLQRASELADLDAALHWEIGRAARRVDASDVAIQELRTALLLSPDLWPASFSLAGLYFEAGQFGQAERQYHWTLRIVEGLGERGTDEERFDRAQVAASCRQRVEACRLEGAG